MSQCENGQKGKWSIESAVPLGFTKGFRVFSSLFSLQLIDLLFWFILTSLKVSLSATAGSFQWKSSKNFLYTKNVAAKEAIFSSVICKDKTLSQGEWLEDFAMWPET